MPVTSDKGGFKTIDEYIATFPEAVQAPLQAMRATIRAAAPDAQEIISYQMPTFYLKGNLVHFGAFKAHIGFYPAPSGIEAFREELAQYGGAKGSIRFPLDEPLPHDLIRRVVGYRVAENLRRDAEKRAKRRTGG